VVDKFQATIHHRDTENKIKAPPSRDLIRRLLLDTPNSGHTVVIYDATLVFNLLLNTQEPVALITSDAKLRSQRRSAVVLAVIERAVEDGRVWGRAAHSCRWVATSGMRKAGAVHHFVNQRLGNLG